MKGLDPVRAIPGLDLIFRRFHSIQRAIRDFPLPAGHFLPVWNEMARSGCTFAAGFPGKRRISFHTERNSGEAACAPPIPLSLSITMSAPSTRIRLPCEPPSFRPCLFRFLFRLFPPSFRPCFRLYPINVLFGSVLISFYTESKVLFGFLSDFL